MNYIAIISSAKHDPSPTHQRLNKNVNNDISLRLYNLTVLTRHIRTYYQETLQQLIVMPLPNILCIAKDPISAKSMEELKRLLLLILGCAVQCERKEEIIEKIKLLDIETQAAIVSHIQEVTHNQLNVLDLSWLDQGAELSHEELEPLSRNMAVSLRQLIDQRDKASEVIVDLCQERDYLISTQPQEGCRTSGSTVSVSGLTKEEKQHLSVELADTKAKLRKYRQELEEKTEQLLDSKHEVERLDQELQRLKQENQSLSCEARSVRVYRDEVDSLREKAARVDRLETELTRCKEKLNDVHFYKSRVEELREDNLTLMETKMLLEEQLSASRGRFEKLHTLEKDNLLLRAKIHDLEMERDNERQRLEELVEENMLLEIGQKQSMNESAHLGWELEQLTKNHDNANTETRKSLVHELNECVSSRVLKLEKENRELQASIERLKGENHLLQEQQLHSQELDRENQGLSKKVSSFDTIELGRAELKEERRRREEGDNERRKLQLDLEQSEKGRKHLEKESLKTRTLLEGKESELEEKSQQLATIEKECVAINKEVDRLKEVAVKAKELEKENKELQKQLTIDKRTLATLREELVSEKLSVQQQNVELERLNEELEKIGLNREKLLQHEYTQEDRYRLLESRLEETVQQTMKVKEEKITTLEKKLKESDTLNTTLRAELATERTHMVWLFPLCSLNWNINQGQGSATAELLRIKDHLINVEKNNASLQTESSLLKEQLKQLENQNTSQNNQMLALQRHTTNLQEQNSSLHTQTAKLQVENSTLSSQSASLMAQNAVLQGQVTALETEVESWQRQREEAWRGRESVLSDHERLLSVHERQAHEYEQLISQHAALKCKQRTLENEHRALHNKYVSKYKEKLEEQEGHVQKEKEELNQEIQKNQLLQQENQEMKTEINRYLSQSLHLEHSEGLQQRFNELKGALSSTQLEVSQWMTRYDSLMEQHQSLDLTMTKLDNHVELLSRLKGNLEEENHHLLSQINLLSQQNHTLLERSMESKELYHQEQKLYIDKLNALRRQKEKLEEKIMDQYKFYDPTPKKRSQWSGAKALAKLIKPRKESSRERVGERDKDGGKERERVKSAPDIPLPAPPPLLPPETPPPLPQRTTSDSQDGGHAHCNLNNHTTSPSLGPLSPAMTPVSRGIHTVHKLYTKKKTYSCHNTSDSVFGFHCVNRLSRLNKFSSNIPVDCVLDTLDCQAHPASHSSDDITGLGRPQQTLSRSSTLPYDHTPQRAQPQRAGGVRSKTRPASPGSEMVTLEEFLQESNLQSPLMVSFVCVSTGSREDLMTDYFSRSPIPSTPTGREQVTPTSYVMPTIQPSNQRPGQSVKPSPRQPVGQSPSSGQPQTQRNSQSLSRAFSLASADLLRSSGPDSFRGKESSPGQSDVVVRRQGGGVNGRERPLSARLAGPTNQLADGSFLNPPIHHSSSLNLQTERFAERERERARTTVSQNGPSSSSSHHHRGEVALVTPVRAIPATRASEGSEHGDVLREGQSGDSSALKKESERARCGSVEHPKSTPASPDPNNDPQTVWYEYGCV
uniref:Protein Daple-like n=1 Tax=Echeneis naucrates TaxID=173247 RepID=A0A665TQQ5_ECHNA